ncbi:MAG: hypothetical protein HY089_10240 [Ignavibacteriales bacterium]|nr:hypothetical protein [Ignavibacteriales bacterium]
MKTTKLAGLFIAAMCVFLSGCSSTVELASAWKTGELNIDGNDNDWSNATTYIKNSGVSIGAKNDNEYLYLCLIATSQTQRQIFMQGLTVWFDAEGSQNKTFGIHFPLGMLAGRRPMTRGANQDPDDMRAQMEQARRELEILGPGKDERQRVLLMQLQDLTLRFGNSQDLLVYELKVPLRKSAKHPYAIGIESGQFVGVGFEVGETRGERLGGGPPAGSPESGGRGRTRGGGAPQNIPVRGEREDILRMWAKVQLSAPQ